MSYNGRLYFGLVADAQAAPDVHRLRDFLNQSYVELRAAAGVDKAAEPEAQPRPTQPTTVPGRAASSGQKLA
jgi:hypothetical protein